MAAPSVTRPAVAINHSGITPSAALFRGCAAFGSYGVNVCNHTSGANGLFGGRYALGSNVNISAHQYLAFTLYFQDITTQHTGTRAAGGWSLVLYDAAGNWSRWVLAFNDAAKAYPYQWEANDQGFWAGYSVEDTDRVVDYTIELTKTPEQTNGTIDLTQIAGYELHCNMSSLGYPISGIRLLRLAAFSQPVIVGGDVTPNGPTTCASILPLFSSDWTGTTAPYKSFKQGKPVGKMFWGASGRSYMLRYGIDFGNGATASRFVDTGFTLSMCPTFDSNYDNYPAQQFQINPKIRFNQSASDYVSLTNFEVSGAAVAGNEYDFHVIGSTSGTFTANNGKFANAGIVDIGHGTVSGVTFDSCVEVIYHSAATYTDCVIRGNTYAASKGLTISGNPGDYSAIDIQFADNTGGHDIEITPSSSGTFDLSSLTVKTGQSLKIHNTTATAITVKLATGITTVLTGGSITIEYPSITATASIAGLIAGSRVHIYNLTKATAPFKNYIAGTSYSANYIDGSDYESGDIIAVRTAWVSADRLTAKLSDEYRTVATVNGWAILISQQDADSYNDLMADPLTTVDPATITEFTSDYPNVEFDIDDTDGNLPAYRCYLWYLYKQWQSQDSLDYFFQCVTAENVGSFRINVDKVNLHFQNVGFNSVMVYGRVYRSDGSRVFVPGNGPVQLEYGEVSVITINTTGSPVITGDVADVLSAIAPIPINPVLTNDARLNNLDAAITSRLPSSGYTAPNNSDIAAIKSKTDLIPATPALAGEYTTAIAAIPTDPLLTTDARLNNLDAAITSRLPAAAYTAPDNAGISALASAIAALNDLSSADVQTLLNALPTDILTAAQANPIHADTQKINGAEVVGNGTEANKWRGSGV